MYEHVLPPNKSTSVCASLHKIQFSDVKVFVNYNLQGIYKGELERELTQQLQADAILILQRTLAL